MIGISREIWVIGYWKWSLEIKVLRFIFNTTQWLGLFQTLYTVTDIKINTWINKLDTFINVITLNIANWRGLFRVNNFETMMNMTVCAIMLYRNIENVQIILAQIKIMQNYFFFTRQLIRKDGAKFWKHHILLNLLCSQIILKKKKFHYWNMFMCRTS